MKHSFRFHYHHLLAIVLVAFSFFMSALVSRTVYERLPHLEDEITYLFQARMLARGQAVIDSPDPARPFWQLFVVDREGKRFGKYPLGWPMMLALGVQLGQLWVINGFLAAGTAALAYRLGRELFDPDTGVIAASLVAFSPMALLLNGSLMGHTAALFVSTLFLYGYWRLERGGQHRLLWGALAGLALGLLVINRPLAGLALAVPFIAWSGVRLARAVISWQSSVVSSQSEAGDPPGAVREPPLQFRLSLSHLWRTLAPLLVLGVIAGLLTLIIPLYSYLATGNPRQNLYVLVWPYDQVGFGEGYGRNIHTLEKGLRQTRWDLSLFAADAFGWQDGPMPDEAVRLRTNSVYWPAVGLSWVLLPFGLALGLGRRWWWWAVWLAGGIGVFMLTTNLPVELLRDPAFANRWMLAAGLWLMLPFGFLIFERPLDDLAFRRRAWTYLLLTLPLLLIILYVAYWVGSQLYSTRYYFEGLVALALLTALPLGWLLRRFPALRWPGYILLTLVLFYTLYGFSQPRITPLYRFNWVNPELIAAVERRQINEQPVLVIVSGSEVRWRSFGALMVSTSPFLDSGIVAAWDNGSPGIREAILRLLPERQVIELTATGNRGCFTDVEPAECYGEPEG